jgi:hypothetical protein
LLINLFCSFGAMINKCSDIEWNWYNAACNWYQHNSKHSTSIYTNVSGIFPTIIWYLWYELNGLQQNIILFSDFNWIVVVRAFFFRWVYFERIVLWAFSSALSITSIDMMIIIIILYCLGCSFIYWFTFDYIFIFYCELHLNSNSGILCSFCKKGRWISILFV